MRTVVLLLALVAVTAEAGGGRFGRVNSRCAGGRSDRGLPCDSYAFLEFAPASGAGMGTACACGTVTGAKGEALTFARTSSATCTKTAAGGLATTGIANGDLVTCASGQPRVEYDSAGVLGLLVESSRQNVLPRYNDLSNAAWSDVGTPSLTGSQTDPFGATTATLIDDNDAAAFEGRSQPVTVTAGSAYFAHCYVKAGTTDKARISIDGTTQDISGLSSTTWSIVEKGDASASGASVSFQVLVGNATTDTGSVVFGGCQVELGTYRTSIIPTTSAAATRQTDNGSIAVTAGIWASQGSGAMSWTPAATGSSAGVIAFGSNGRILYGNGANILAFDGTNNPSTAANTVANSVKRYWASWSTPGGWVVRNETSGNQATSAFTVGTWSTDTSLDLNVAGIIPDGIISRICLDPDTTRCR